MSAERSGDSPTSSMQTSASGKEPNAPERPTPAPSGENAVKEDSSSDREYSPSPSNGQDGGANVAKPPVDSVAASPAMREDSPNPVAIKPAPPPVPAVSTVDEGIAPLPPASRSRLKHRHIIVMASFFLMVILPMAIVAWYLWVRAVDQYVSNLGFSVRSEEVAPAIDSVLGTMDVGGGSSTADTSVLYEFIQSQDMVVRVDETLDLRTLWSKADPDVDPYFSYDPPGSIEDLVSYWGRMVRVFLDSSSGLIDVQVRAFAPEDAQRIAERIFEESSDVINELSAIAQEDAIRYSRQELDQAVERLKNARSELTRFRNRTQIVDPSIDTQRQAGLLSSLEQELSKNLIELDILRDTARANDPRIAQGERRVRVIEQRIAEERKKLGLGSEDAEEVGAFADLVGEYESLSVDREFAEQAYLAALAAHDSAQAEARRKSRYIAPHIQPTLAEDPSYPRRLTILLGIGFFLFVVWAIIVLVGYSVKDRR